MLHIEDDSANRLLVRKILTGDGFAVTEANDGLEGVRLARGEPPDLVLVDLNIPGLDGYEVTLRLRGDARLRNVPIVAITAEGDRSTSLAVGCDGFIQKPINARTFAATIRGFLQGHREEVSKETADRRLRAQSQRIVARLEAKVAELSEANERLVDAAKAKTAFYRNISHELATPMTPVVGYIKLLVDQELGELNPAQRKALKAMDDCVRRLRSTIDNLLDVTGFETGRMRFIHADYDMGDVIRRTVHLLGQKCVEHSIRLVVDIPDRKMPAWGDAERLSRGVGQVLDNAIKFTPDGGVVGVRLTHHAPVYEICIADTGPGIPQELLSKVLEPFFQIDASPTRQFGGVGVGLAIARRVARAMGGDLQVRSPANETIGGISFRGTACLFAVAERAPNIADTP